MWQLDNENPDNDVADGDDKAKEDIKLKRQLSRRRRKTGEEGTRAVAMLSLLVSCRYNPSILTCQTVAGSRLAVKLRNLQLYLCVPSVFFCQKR